MQDAKLNALTPMLRQYFSIKRDYPDTMLLFRMGDFYEIFGEDAEKAADLLDIVLTSRERGDKKKIPFCGVPHHAAKSYFFKLMQAGLRVAIAEQIDNPATTKGLLRRAVTKVLSPGCMDELEALEPDAPNYLLALMECTAKGKRQPKGSELADSNSAETRPWWAVLIDVSTGEMRKGQLGSLNEALDYAACFQPKEILVRRFAEAHLRSAWAKHGSSAKEPLWAHIDEGWLRSEDRALTLLRQRLGQTHTESTSSTATAKTADPTSVSIEPQVRGLMAAVFAYLDHLHVGSAHILSVRPLHDPKHMPWDPVALRDLEIFHSHTSAPGHQRKATLFYQLNATMTPMGARALRQRLAAPFVRKDDIEQALESLDRFVELGMKRRETLDLLRNTAKGCPDLERLSVRLANRTITPQQLARLREALAKLLDIEKIKPSFSEGMIDLSRKTHALLSQALLAHPEALGSGQHVLQPNFDPAYGEVIKLCTTGDQAIEQYAEKLRNQTGISNLKIKRHKTFGLLIEVTRSHLGKVPEGFTRKQTMVNCERFITPELKALFEDIEQAQGRAIDLEAKLYEDLVSQLAPKHVALRQLAHELAEWDLLQSLAWISLDKGYVRPKVHDSRLNVRGGRHPVVEAFVGKSQFVPNDVMLDQHGRQLLITGPNMAGKSTIMRQVALWAVCQQIGSYVPAVSAELPVFDRIFTRVGASDDLAKGQSTFMVEMSEAAGILRNSTADSLVLLDEVGRGTSSQDGQALAAAIFKDLCTRVGCITLFATHYHELTELAGECPSIRLMQTEVLEEVLEHEEVLDHEEVIEQTPDAQHHSGGHAAGGSEQKRTLTFTRRLVPGICSRSFGLEVADLAGLPAHVISEARRRVATGRHMFGSDESTGPNKSDEVAGQRQSIHSSAFCDSSDPADPADPADSPASTDSSDLRDATDTPYPSISSPKSASPTSDLLGIQQDRVHTQRLEKWRARVLKTRIDRLTPLKALNLLDDLQRDLRKIEQPSLFDDHA